MHAFLHVFQRVLKSLKVVLEHLEYSLVAGLIGFQVGAVVFRRVFGKQVLFTASHHLCLVEVLPLLGKSAHLNGIH